MYDNRQNAMTSTTNIITRTFKYECFRCYVSLFLPFYRNNKKFCCSDWLDAWMSYDKVVSNSQLGRSDELIDFDENI